MPPTIRVRGEADLVAQILREIELQKLTTVPVPRTRSLPIPAEIVVAIGSAGAFTALYQVINKFLERNKDRELRLESQGRALTIKAHSLPEEQALLKQLAPELVEQQPK
jgi:hypothetical protein